MGTKLLWKIIINLRDGSAPYWRKCLKQTYPEIIVGSQRRDSVVQAIIQEACSTWVNMTNIQEAKDSRAVKHVVYWKLNNSQSSAEDGAASPTKSSQPFKVILLSSVRSSRSVYPVDRFSRTLNLHISGFNHHVLESRSSLSVHLTLSLSILLALS